MTDTNNYEMAVATVSNVCGLDAREFSGLLETMRLLTAEQRNRIIIYSSAWAAKDLIENKEKVS